MTRILLVVLSLSCSSLALAQNSKTVLPARDAPTVKIVAEGAGTTADEALKDAFRNAVRQVVGAVLDAETLVKIDEIISDQVLTYSDGFVKTYEEISKTGDITDLELVDGPIELAGSAVDAVRQWKYKPYLLMGQPVTVDTQIQVNYQLSR